MTKYWQRYRRHLVTLVTLGLLWHTQTSPAQNTSVPQAGVDDAQGLSFSANTRDFLERRWDDASFNQGLSLVEDPGEPVESRTLAMEKLRGNRRALSVRKSRQLFDRAVLLAGDPSEPPGLSTSAIRTMSSVAVLMEERGQVSEGEIQREASFLINIAADDTRDTELRAAAIRALGDLRPAGAVGLLQGLLDDPVQVARPEIARNALLAVRAIEGADAIDSLSAVLASTQDPAIFGTAAYSLGQINTAESMAELVKYESRFPESNSVDAVLVDMQDIILDVLGDPSNEKLLFAVEATRHLWRDGQRELYMPRLRELLTTAPAGSRKVVLDRLLDAAGKLEFDAEKYELELILAEIADQPRLDAYSGRIRRRLAATVLVPSGPGRPVPETGN